MEELIYKTLLERGYDEKSATMVLPDLLNLSEPLKSLLKAWLENEKHQSDYAVAGFSVSELQKERGMNYPAALLTIDWLIKDPENAKRSLTKGIR